MPKKVLIVEDYADVRRIMEIIVRHKGYDVIGASDGYEAVEKVKQYHPDLILMDLAMPIMDGITATQVIRGLDGFRKIPIIALTAYGSDYYKRAIKAGCNEVINKPLEFKGIAPLLKQYLAE
ncbi:MAG TPA: response regulator [Pyrinomonadaceae bacterium]|nr:response regulator [Pyrinomonadaceae bacterium]